LYCKLPSGLAKICFSSVHKTPDNGILAAAFGPSTVSTTINGKLVHINLVTDYPFGETLTYTVVSSIAFPFKLRIPSWANNPTIKVGTGSATPVTPGQIYSAQIPQGTTVVTLQLPMTVRLVPRPNGAVAVYRGPLLYSLKIGTKWTSTHHYAYNSYDWVIAPTTPWNYALVINPSNPSTSFTFKQGNVGPLPFSEDGAPVSLIASGKILDSWTVTQNSAAPPPQSPVTSPHPSEQVTLIPFGATPLRIVEFPYIRAQ